MHEKLDAPKQKRQRHKRQRQKRQRHRQKRTPDATQTLGDGDDHRERGAMPGTNQTQATFGFSRPQFVFHTFYHKTGHDISNLYMTALDKMEKSITHLTKYRKETMYKKRTHDPNTGCPELDDTLSVWKQQRMPKIHVIPFTAPDFLCDLDQHEFFSQNHNEESRRQEVGVKFIHMIRDPFDMAISMYLYHSQQPSPEYWVFKYDPCEVNHEALRFWNTSSDTTTQLITQQQVRDLEYLCHDLMLNNNTNTPYVDFYYALLELPLYDGLRLSTLVLLISGGTGGAGDILRMTHNVERLREWQRASSSNTIISTMMHPDWDRDNYGASLDRLTEFVLADLEVLGDGSGGENDGGDSVAANEAALQKYKEEFVRKVRIEAMDSLHENHSKRPKHITTNTRMTLEERKLTVAKLRADELFGPILSTCQTIVNSADGLKHYTRQQ